MTSQKLSPCPLSLWLTPLSQSILLRPETLKVFGTSFCRWMWATSLEAGLAVWRSVRWKKHTEGKGWSEKTVMSSAALLKSLLLDDASLLVRKRLGPRWYLNVRRSNNCPKRQRAPQVSGIRGEEEPWALWKRSTITAAGNPGDRDGLKCKGEEVELWEVLVLEQCSATSDFSPVKSS